MLQDPRWFVPVFIPTRVASYIIGVIAHEFGHAGMGWLVGLPPRLIRIGEGPPLLRLRPGSALFDMRCWRLYGYVAYLPPPDGRTWSRILRRYGGFLVNARILAATLVLWDRFNGFDDEAFLGRFDRKRPTLPHRRRHHPVLVQMAWSKRGQRHVVDPALLRRARISTHSELYAAQMRLVLPAGAATPAPSAAAAEIVHSITRRDRLTDPWTRRDASAGLQSVLASDALPQPERVLALQNLALIERSTKGEGSKGESSLALMDAWSQEAVALAPCPCTLVKLGGVLLALGRPAEALALLGPVAEGAAAIGRGPMCRPISIWPKHNCALRAPLIRLQRM